MSCGHAFVHNPGCDGCSDAESRAIVVQGCFALPLENSHVNIWSNSSKTTLLHSTTSDVSGMSYVSISPGSYYAEFSASRFLTLVEDPFIVPASTLPIYRTLSPDNASGYYCARGCPTELAYPIKETLYATNSLGSWTLARNQFGAWLSEFSGKEYPACGSIPCRGCNAAGDVPTRVAFAALGCAGLIFKFANMGCNSPFACPWHDSANEVSFGYDKTYLSPYIPSKSAYMLVGRFSQVGFFAPPPTTARTCVLENDTITITE